MTYGEFIGWLVYTLHIDIGRVECAWPELTNTPLDGWHSAEDAERYRGKNHAQKVINAVRADHPTWWLDAMVFIEMAPV